MGVFAQSFNVLSLCSGGGGLDLGIKLAVRNSRVVCCVEREIFACGVLATRMQEELLDEAPIWTDLTSFDGKPWRPVVDCVIGGIPCQPFSIIGRKKGRKDERYLWDDAARIIAETKPTIVFFENVENLLKNGFERIALTLSEMGFDVEAEVFSAAEMGAPHLRERLFFMGHASGEPFRTRTGTQGPQAQARGRSSGMGVFPPSPRQFKAWERIIQQDHSLKPGIRSMADELASGMDPDRRRFGQEQLRLLGNGVVPVVAGYAFLILLRRLQSRTQPRP